MAIAMTVLTIAVLLAVVSRHRLCYIDDSGSAKAEWHSHSYPLVYCGERCGAPRRSREQDQTQRWADDQHRRWEQSSRATRTDPRVYEAELPNDGDALRAPLAVTGIKTIEEGASGTPDGRRNG